MSKKHKSQGGQLQAQAAGGQLSHEAEYRIIKGDLVKVIILNVVYLAAILALYYANRGSHAVDNWFVKILHF